MNLGPGRLTRTAVWSRRLGTFAVPLAVLGTTAHRAGLADGVPGIAVLAIFIGCALLGLLLGLLALVRIWQEGFDGLRQALTGIVWSALVLAVPASFLPAAVTLPALTQATTDVADPPGFVWALRDRPRWAVNLEALPRTQEARQSEAYPTLVPLRVDVPSSEAYQLALQLVEERGWRVLDRRPPQNRIPGRIEAVARTRFYAFRDDVVIRITPLGNEARLDMRSASRVGLHDLGTNARRIIDFLTEMRDRAVER